MVQDTDETLCNPKEEDDGEDQGEKEWQYDDYGRDRLSLDKAINANSETRNQSEANRTGSLHDFLRLTHLSIIIITLLDPNNNWGPPFRSIDALPPILVYLCIYGYRSGLNLDMDEHIDEVIEKKGEKLPKLDVIKGANEHVPHLQDILGAGDEPNEDNLYNRKELALNWKELTEAGNNFKNGIIHKLLVH